MAARLIITTITCAIAICGGLAVHRAALTPEEAEARVTQIPEVNWDNVVDDGSEKLTIRWYPLPRFPSGLDSAFGVKLLEKEFNVDIEPILQDARGYSRRKPLMFASGNVPDITWDGDPLDVQRDIYHGCIVPVPLSVIKKHAPTYFKIVTDVAPMGWLYCHHNDMNWGLPIIWLGGGYSLPGLWRKDWLEKVGITKEPETLEEFHEAFKRFTFNDPDGNGEQDTYGLTNTTIGWYQMFTEFFGAYNTLPFDWEEKDGKIVWGGITPEAKATLNVLRDWYKEGIIDPEFVTDGLNRQRTREKFINGRVGYGYCLGQYREFDEANPAALSKVMAKLSPQAKIAVATFPEGPGGRRGARNWGTAANIYVFGKGVIEKPQKLIRILKIIEYQIANGPDTYMLHRMGIKDKHWEFRDPKIGQASGTRRKPPYDDNNLFQKEVLTIWAGTHPEYDAMFMPKAQREFINKYRRAEFCMVDALAKPGIVPSASKYLSDLRNHQLAVYTEIIRGEKPLDAFDGFKEAWLNRGGRIMTKEANELLQVRNKLFKKLGVKQ